MAILSTMVVATLAVCALGVTALPGDAATYPAMWAEYKTKYGKSYLSAAEEAKRFEIFTQNMEKAAKLMKTNPLATFGANLFADRSEAEFKTFHSGGKVFEKMVAKQAPVGAAKTPVKTTSVSKVDWRQQGAVTPVKNQGQCGSCWSFSTTGSIEGQWKLAGHPLVALSEQELVSCDTTDSACNGGLMDNAFEWLVNNQNGWITSEAAYPYVSGDGVVPACALPKPQVAQITGHQDIAHSEDAMATFVGTSGPLSIAVDATSWQTYNSGIMTNCISQRIDHGVLIVGYDDTNSPPYWIIKNSWTDSWGESGYIRVEKGTDQCLLTSAPCTSTVAAAGPTPPPAPTPSPVPTPPNPNPPTPAPWSPTPPTPAGGHFTQYTCDDMFCILGCTKQRFPTGQCLRDEAGGSVIAECRDGGLKLKVYDSSADCHGSYQSVTEPVDQCLPDQSGSFVYDTCEDGTPKKAAEAGKLRNAAEKAKPFRMPSAVKRELAPKKH